ncbi:hypothetical protein Pmani_010129 [Petrolisthes manimaculis]|uniref:Uncharacterized protein n=1 Tax=Petrolisthes manimaculis TaxID=1843537 RepID=A0AAE1Q245_9EUCA|nr:hypothetical protein Pmani_010129 [Petrolisthes manimaculis]
MRDWLLKTEPQVSEGSVIRRGHGVVTRQLLPVSVHEATSCMPVQPSHYYSRCSDSAAVSPLPLIQMQ